MKKALAVFALAAFAACRKPSDGISEAEARARWRYLWRVSYCFPAHESWRKNRVIQAHIGRVYSDKSSRDTIEHAGRIGFTESRSQHLIFKRVAHDPDKMNRLRKEVLSLLVEIHKDMGVLSTVEEARASDENARISGPEGRISWEAKWEDAHHPIDKTLTIDYQASLLPETPPSPEQAPLRLVKKLRTSDMPWPYDAVACLSSDDPDERIRAALTLRLDTEDEKATKAVLSAIVREKDEEVTPFLFTALHHCMYEPVLDGLLGFIQSDRREIWSGAAEVILFELPDWSHKFRQAEKKLGEKARRRLRTVAVAGLSSEDWGRRVTAAKLLHLWGIAGDSEAQEALFNAIASEIDTRCFPCLFRPLRNCTDKGLFDRTLALVEDERPEVWCNAVDTVSSHRHWWMDFRKRKNELAGRAKLRAQVAGSRSVGFENELKALGEDAFPFLSSLAVFEVHERCPRLFSRACAMLAHLGDTKAVPVLVKALGDFKRYGRCKESWGGPGMALQAVNKLTGRNYGGIGGDVGNLPSRERESVDWERTMKELHADYE